MKIKNTLFERHQIVLTGWLKQNLDKINPNITYNYVGLNNDNSNINIINTKFQNNIPIFTHDSGKTVINQNTILIQNKIQDITFNNGIIYSPYTTNYKIMGEYNINTHFPTIVLNVTGVRGRQFSSMYLNDGNKTFWSPLNKGMLLSSIIIDDQFKQNNLPHRLNGYTVTNTYIGSVYGDSNRINGLYIVSDINSYQSTFTYTNCTNIKVLNHTANLILENINSGYVENLISGNLTIRNSNVYVLSTYVDNNQDLLASNSNVYIQQIDNDFPVLGDGEHNSYLYLNNNAFKSAITAYQKDGIYNNISGYLDINKSSGNVLANHYHSQFQIQYPHTNKKIVNNMSYVSNAPIGSIIWWPQSWIGRRWNQRDFVYNPPLKSNNWKACSGVSVAGSLYHKMYDKNKTPDLLRKDISYKNLVSNNEVINYDHYADQQNLAFIINDSIEITVNDVHVDAAGRFCRTGVRIATYTPNSFGFKLYVDAYCTKDGGDDDAATAAKNIYATIYVKNKSKINGIELVYMENNDEKSHSLIPSSDGSSVAETPITINTTDKISITFKYLKYKNLIIPLRSIKKGSGSNLSQTKIYELDSQKANPGGPTLRNYGVFRRLVPYIKVNDYIDEISQDQPTPYDINQNYIYVLGIRKEFNNNLISYLNLNNLPTTGYLHHCYFPYEHNRILNTSLFKNNIITNSLDLISEKELSKLYQTDNNYPITAIVNGSEIKNCYLWEPKQNIQSEDTEYKNFKYIQFPVEKQELTILSCIFDNFIPYNKNSYSAVDNLDMDYYLSFSNFKLSEISNNKYECKYDIDISKFILNKRLMKIIIDTLDGEPIQPSSGWPNQSEISNEHHLWYGYNIPYFNNDEITGPNIPQFPFLGNDEYQLMNIKNWNSLVALTTTFDAFEYSNTSARLTGVPHSYNDFNTAKEENDAVTYASSLALSIKDQLTTTTTEKWIECTLSEDRYATPYQIMYNSSLSGILGSVKITNTTCVKYPEQFDSTLYDNTLTGYYKFIEPFRKFKIESTVDLTNDTEIKNNFEKRISCLCMRLASGINNVNAFTDTEKIKKYLGKDVIYTTEQEAENYSLTIPQYKTGGLLSLSTNITLKNDDFSYF